MQLLDQRNIQHSSVDLVRFSFVDDDKDEDDCAHTGEFNTTEDFNLLYRRRVVITPITIWVGVLPDTLTCKDAYKSSVDILNLLREHGISDLDVAYRESVVKDSSGPELFAPVSDFDPLKVVIDPLTTALSLPIAGLDTLYIQGTMGFYFKVGEDLYGVTARHVLFPENEGNNTYSYVGMFPPF